MIPLLAAKRSYQERGCDECGLSEVTSGAQGSRISCGLAAAYELADLHDERAMDSRAHRIGDVLRAFGLGAARPWPARTWA
jgi:hypothetical protein